MKMKEVKNQIIHKDEIDLVAITRIIWSKRRYVVKVTSIFFVLSLLIAFTSKKEYEVTCKLLPETRQNSNFNLSGLKGLASLTGVNVSNFEQSNRLTPLIYPEIVHSAPFMLELIHTPVYFEKLDSLVSGFEYFDKIDKPSLLGYIAQYTVGLLGKIKKWINNSKKEEVWDDKNIVGNLEIKKYTKKEHSLIKNYSSRFSINVESKNGIIEVTGKFPDAFAVAQITNMVVNKLTKDIIKYKTEKAKINLEFIEHRFKEAESKYESKERKLAKFVDRNRNISNSMANVGYVKLQNELEIAKKVYMELSVQLEQAKIKMKEDTPVFTVLEPVNIPISTSGANTKLIVLASVFLGLFIASTLVLLKHYLQQRK